MHDCYRWIALLDKYYGHRHYRICFAHAKLQSWNDDAQLRNCFDLINTYTREEIKVKYILNCLYAELQVSHHQTSKMCWIVVCWSLSGK